MAAGRGRMSSVEERMALKRQSLENEIRNIETPGALTSVLPGKAKTIPANPDGGPAFGGLEYLLESIAALDINNALMLKKIQFGILNHCSSVLTMQSFIQHVHSLALTDPVFGLRAAAALATASNVVVEGVKMRNILIKFLQNDFTRSEELRKTNNTEFMNMVGFLGQVFSRFKLNGEPIKVLAVPHLVYQKRLLDGDETELELCMLLLAQNGELLSQCQGINSTLLSDFFVAILSGLLTKDFEKNIRGWFMLGYFMYSNNYEFTPAYLNLFKSVLGAASMSRIKCALVAGRTKLPIEVLEEKSIAALKAGPPKDDR